jgi:hypothetical protein
VGNSNGISVRPASSVTFKKSKKRRHNKNSYTQKNSICFNMDSKKKQNLKATKSFDSKSISNSRQ